MTKKNEKKAPVLQLWHDQWTASLPDNHLINTACNLRHELEGVGYRAEFNKTQDGRLAYSHLRWVLLVLSKSKLLEPTPSRRLTWRERLTGRAQA